MNFQALETLWEFEANPDLVWSFLSRVEGWHSWWPKIKEVYGLESEKPESHYLLWKVSSGDFLGLELQVSDKVLGQYLEAHLEGGFLRFALRSEAAKTQVWVSWAGLPELDLTLQTLEDLGRNLAARIEASRGWLP